MAAPAPGFNRIQTTTGTILTLLAQGGTLTALAPNGAPNQTWDFQLVGATWTIRNTAYPAATFAFSGGGQAALVSGGVATQWAIVPNAGFFSIQPGNDAANAWNVGPNAQVTLQPFQAANVAQRFSIVPVTAIHAASERLKWRGGKSIVDVPGATLESCSYQASFRSSALVFEAIDLLRGNVNSPW
ncbi:hypothetical protein OG21DRAFT_1548218 [Imleria badia]|nr:hypothetical protein OG21DRAFT_1548218 [Imleria badia]